MRKGVEGNAAFAEEEKGTKKVYLLSERKTFLLEFVWKRERSDSSKQRQREAKSG